MSQQMWIEIFKASGETLYMVLLSGSIAVMIGLPLGIILYLSQKDGPAAANTRYRILSALVNIGRSIPFIILLVAVIPITRLIVGTSIGTTAAIVPLTIGAIPFFARIVENALEEVPQGLLEAGQAMGAKPWQIIHYMTLPEALSSIINGITLTLVTLVSYSAMAGAVGGGGLGDLAIRYGYQRFDLSIMIITIVILVLMVQCLQSIGSALARRVNYS